MCRAYSARPIAAPIVQPLTTDELFDKVVKFGYFSFGTSDMKSLTTAVVNGTAPPGLRVNTKLDWAIEGSSELKDYVILRFPDVVKQISIGVPEQHSVIVDPPPDLAPRVAKWFGPPILVYVALLLSKVNTSRQFIFPNRQETGGSSFLCKTPCPPVMCCMPAPRYGRLFCQLCCRNIAVQSSDLISDTLATGARTLLVCREAPRCMGYARRAPFYNDGERQWNAVKDALRELIWPNVAIPPVLAVAGGPPVNAVEVNLGDNLGLGVVEPEGDPLVAVPGGDVDAGEFSGVPDLGGLLFGNPLSPGLHPPSP